MNEKQVIYQIGRLFNGYSDLVRTGLSGVFVLNSLREFLNIQGTSDYASMGMGTISALLAVCVGYSAFRHARQRYHLHKDLREINKEKEKYPLEHVDSVVFKDTDGLVRLLERTSKSRFLEWGTYVNAHAEDGVAIIDNVLDFDEAKRRGLIGEGSLVGLRADKIKADEEGYNGMQHYHPSGTNGSSNFSIGLKDKDLPKNWINFITFNMDGRPDIIAYNRQSVYIPKNKVDKCELVKATPKQVMQYLAT